jgi:hypothetical protein
MTLDLATAACLLDVAPGELEARVARGELPSTFSTRGALRIPCAAVRAAILRGVSA